MVLRLGENCGKALSKEKLDSPDFRDSQWIKHGKLSPMSWLKMHFSRNNHLSKIPLVDPWLKVTWKRQIGRKQQQMWLWIWSVCARCFVWSRNIRNCSSRYLFVWLKKTHDTTYPFFIVTQATTRSFQSWYFFYTWAEAAKVCSSNHRWDRQQSSNLQNVVHVHERFPRVSWPFAVHCRCAWWCKQTWARQGQ